MGDMGIFLYYAVIALFAFFVVGPCLLNTVSLFGVQKQFAKTMVEEGVISQAEVDRLHPKKQIAGILISAVVFGALVFLAQRNTSIGYLCGAIALAASFMKYRRILQFNSLTVKRFRNTYRDSLDAKKFNKYVDTHF